MVEQFDTYSIYVSEVTYGRQTLDPRSVVPMALSVQQEAERLTGVREVLLPLVDWQARLAEALERSAEGLKRCPFGADGAEETLSPISGLPGS